MDKILVLGINGFTGRHFQRYIKDNGLLTGYSFVGADKTIDPFLPVDYRETDLIATDELEKLIIHEKPDYILNLAGNFTVADQDQLLLINAELPHRILEIVAKNKIDVKNITLIGSAAEYGAAQRLPVKESDKLNPVNFYGLTKVFQTHYASFYHKVFDLNVCIARTFNIIGEGMSTALSISSFIKQINEVKGEGSIHTGSLNTKRDYLDIADVIDAYWKIMISGAPGSVYNVCSGRSVFIKDMLEHLIDKSGKSIEIEVNQNFIKKNDPDDVYGDNLKLINELNWKPRKNIYHTLESLLKNKP